LTRERTLTNTSVAGYRQTLEELNGFESVEVIIARGHTDGPVDRSLDESLDDSGGTVAARHIAVDGSEWVSLARAGLSAATGDHLIVLDVDRHYPPRSLRRVIQRLRAGDSDLAVAVPHYHGRSSLARWSCSRFGLGFVSRFLLGSSDVLSGLFALRRSIWDQEDKHVATSGSSLVLELLLRRPARCVDVPVAVDDQFRSHRLSLKDLRPLKHLLDGRFGNLSRLVQFCVVGASGMVVDLTFYAFFQLLLSYTWLFNRESRLFGFSWHLAIAAALSIGIALLWNFTLNRRLTFNDARRGSWLRQFFTYVLSNALAIALSFSLRLYLPTRIGFFARHKLAAAVVGIVAATGVSFSMSRWIVFTRRSDRKRSAQPAAT
jgi:dolichol-phosphate mannosyltransferase